MEKRRLRAAAGRKRFAPAVVLLGWTRSGRPVASIPLRSPDAIEARVKIWRRKGYRVSTLVEWDFM